MRKNTQQDAAQDEVPGAPGSAGRKRVAWRSRVGPRAAPSSFSRRERQIMDIVYRRGQATAADVQAEMADAPSYSTVRTLLTLLEGKGHLRHQQDGPRYLYQPAIPQGKARRAALQQLVKTFFGGSPARAAAALLEDAEIKSLPKETLDRLQKMIEATRTKEEK